MFEFFASNPDPWFCGPCKEPAIKLLNGLFEIEKRLKEVEEKVDGHDVRIVALENNGGVGAAGVKDEIIKEMKQREEKRNNLVIRGVKESDSVWETAKVEDQDAVKKIVANIGVDLDVSRDILFMSRLGRKGGYDRGGGAYEGGEYTRPLLIGFKSLDMRERFLERAKRMKNIPELESIYIDLDLTKIQMEEHKSLLKRAEEKSNQGDGKFKVVGKKGQGRIVRARN